MVVILTPLFTSFSWGQMKALCFDQRENLKVFMCSINIKRAPIFQMPADGSARSCVTYVKNTPQKIKSFWNYATAIQVVRNARGRRGHIFISNTCLI